MTAAWTDMYGPPDAKCRGCDRGIYRCAFGWEDIDGLTVCVKASPAAIAQGSRPDYVQHQPMPAGLAGAPESLDAPP